MSYEPAEDGGVEPRGLTTATSFQGPLPRRRRIFPKFHGERGGPDPHRPYGHPLSKRRLPPGRFSFRGWRRTRSAGVTLIRIPNEAGAPVRFTIHKKRAGESNATAVSRAVVSSDAQHPGWFTLRAEPRIRTANIPVLNGTPLPVGLVRHASGWPDLNGRPLPWRGSALAKLSYNRMY